MADVEQRDRPGYASGDVELGVRGREARTLCGAAACVDLAINCISSAGGEGGEVYLYVCVMKKDN